MAYAVAASGFIVFGSGTDAVVAHPGVLAEIDAQALYEYVYFHMIPGPRSAIRGVSRLRPGTYGLFKARGVEVRPCWEMRYVENEAAPLRRADAPRCRDKQSKSARPCFPDAHRNRGPKGSSEPK
jgi:asparagine synthase (glutamine-hydrolysing)